MTPRPSPPSPDDLLPHEIRALLPIAPPSLAEPRVDDARALFARASTRSDLGIGARPTSGVNTRIPRPLLGVCIALVIGACAWFAGTLFLATNELSGEGPTEPGTTARSLSGVSPGSRRPAPADGDSLAHLSPTSLWRGIPTANSADIDARTSRLRRTLTVERGSAIDVSLDAW